MGRRIDCIWYCSSCQQKTPALGIGFQVWSISAAQVLPLHSEFFGLLRAVRARALQLERD